MTEPTLDAAIAIFVAGLGFAAWWSNTELKKLRVLAYASWLAGGLAAFWASFMAAGVVAATGHLLGGLLVLLALLYSAQALINRVGTAGGFK